MLWLPGSSAVPARRVCLCLWARSYAGSTPTLTVGVVRVLYARHGAPAEHHLVLGQRARFVREHVLDLPQVFRDVQRAALQAGVGLLVVQLRVLVDEVHLAHFDDFDGDVQGNGNQNLGDTGQPE